MSDQYSKQIDTAHKLNGEQIERIIDKLVPLIAKPEDYEFFRGVLFIKAEESTSGQFAYFVNRLLKSCSSDFKAGTHRDCEMRQREIAGQITADDYVPRNDGDAI